MEQHQIKYASSSQPQSSHAIKPLDQRSGGHVQVVKNVTSTTHEAKMRGQGIGSPSILSNSVPLTQNIAGFSQGHIGNISIKQDMHHITTHSQALSVGSHRKSSKIQINMKNGSRFNTRKGSQPQNNSDQFVNQQMYAENLQFDEDRLATPHQIAQVSTQKSDHGKQRKNPHLPVTNPSIKQNAQFQKNLSLQRNLQKQPNVGSSAGNRSTKPGSKSMSRKEKNSNSNQFNQFFHPQTTDTSLFSQTSASLGVNQGQNQIQLNRFEHLDSQQYTTNQPVMSQQYFSNKDQQVQSSFIQKVANQNQRLANSEMAIPQVQHDRHQALQVGYPQGSGFQYDTATDRFNNLQQIQVLQGVSQSTKDKMGGSFKLTTSQQAQLKHNLQKTQAQVEAIFSNQGYQSMPMGSVQKANRKLKNSSQIARKNQNQMQNLQGLNSNQNTFHLNNTQNIRFQNQNVTNSMGFTQQIGNTKQSNGTLNDISQKSLLNTQTVNPSGQYQFETAPGQAQYSNTQILDRLFANNTASNNNILPATQGSTKKKSSKVQTNQNYQLQSQSNKDFNLNNAQNYIQNVPQNIQNAHLVSAYNIQNGSVSMQHMSGAKQKPGSSGGRVSQSVGKYNSTGGIKNENNISNKSIQRIANQTANLVSLTSKNIDPRANSQQKNGENKGSAKNNMYLQQQILNNRAKSLTSKFNQNPHQGQFQQQVPNSVERRLANQSNEQHRKTHSVGAQQRNDSLIQDINLVNQNNVQNMQSLNSLQQSTNNGSRTKIVKVPSSKGSNQKQSENFVVGVPGDQSSNGVIVKTGSKSGIRILDSTAETLNGQQITHISKSKGGLQIVPQVPIGHAPQLNAQGQLISDKRRQRDTMTPDSDRDDSSKKKYLIKTGGNSNVIFQDGGTGASLKRVFHQQDSVHTSQADSASQNGIKPPLQNQGQMSYQLPLKQNSNSTQQKKFVKQKNNAQYHNVSSSGRQHQASSEFGAPSPLLNNSLERVAKENSKSSNDIEKKDRTQSNLNQTTLISDFNTSAKKQDDDTPVEPSHKASNAFMGSRKSINITEEALSIGKLPTEVVASNIAQGQYDENGLLKQRVSVTSDQRASPRVQEMIQISNQIKAAFKQTKDAPSTTPDFYRAGKMLGRGAFGKVNLGMHKLTRKLIAIKSINKEYLSEEKQRNKVMHEVNILLKLRHSSVVKLYETFETRRHIMLAMELCAGGDLLNFVRKRKKLDEPVAKVLFKQIIEGLGYIHSQRILHRDIKLDNILLDGKGNVKIADFGVSKLVKKGEVMHEQSGTPAYIAPEIIKDKGYKGFKADLWSAGVVLFAMLYGTVPFKANNMKELHAQIKAAQYNLKDEISEDAKDLIKRLLNVSPSERLSVSQVLKHTWLQNCDAEFKGQEIFNDQEKAVIRNEFTYNNPERFNRNEKIHFDQEPWDCFTELNLDSMNEILRNASSKSLILAPFNSTMSDVQGFFKSVLKMAPMEPKRDILKFAARCRDQDRQYEINNNAELDNGVYHKFVYSSKEDTKEGKSGKSPTPAVNQRQEENLLSRNSSRRQLASKKGESSPYGSDDGKQDAKQKLSKASLAEREALKADIRKRIRKDQQQSDDDEDLEFLASMSKQTEQALDEERIKILINFGYPRDYVKYSIAQNEANYCLAGYYLLAIDQNY